MNVDSTVRNLDDYELEEEEDGPTGDKMIVDATYESEVEALVQKFGISPHDVNFLPILTHLGHADNLIDVNEGIKLAIDDRIPRNNDGGVYRRLASVSDTQEYLLIHSDLDNKRKSLQKKIDVYRNWQKNNLAKSSEVDNIIESLIKQRDEVDRLRPHLWGPFHGVMGGIRGLGRLYGDILFAPLSTWTHHEKYLEKMMLCSYGYHEVAIDWFTCILIGWTLNGIYLYDQRGINLDVSTEQKLVYLSAHSDLFNFTDHIVRTVISKVLNLEDACKFTGWEGNDILGAALRDIFPFYAVAGNYLLCYAVAKHITTLLTCGEEEANSYMYNSNSFNPRTGKCMAWDKKCETGIKETKQNVKNPNVDNVIEKAKICTFAPGRVKNFQEQLFGPETKQGTSLGSNSRRTTDYDATISRITAAFSFSLNHQIIKELQMADVSGGGGITDYRETESAKLKLRFVVVPPKKTPKEIPTLRDYVNNCNSEFDARRDKIVQFTLRSQLGGPCISKDRKCMHKALTPCEQAKKQSLKTLSKKVTQQGLFMAAVFNENPDLLHAFTLICIIINGGLRHANKALLRKVCEDYFWLKHVEHNVVKYAKSPSNCCLIEGGGKQFTMSVVLYDGNMFFRKFRDLNRYKVGAKTGKDHLADNFYQTMKEDINAPLLDNQERMHLFVVDVGQCLQKKVEESRRDKDKTVSKSTTLFLFFQLYLFLYVICLIATCFIYMHLSIYNSNQQQRRTRHSLLMYCCQDLVPICSWN